MLYTGLTGRSCQLPINKSRSWCCIQVLQAGVVHCLLTSPTRDAEPRALIAQSIHTHCKFKKGLLFAHPVYNCTAVFLQPPFAADPFVRGPSPSSYHPPMMDNHAHRPPPLMERFVMFLYSRHLFTHFASVEASVVKHTVVTVSYTHLTLPTIYSV